MAAPMPNVRVKLVFPDTSQNCWFLVNRDNDQTIYDVEERLSSRFNIDRSCVRLFLDGCRLPTEESTHVLHDNDTVNVRLTRSSSTSGAGNDTLIQAESESFTESKAAEKEKKKQRKQSLKRSLSELSTSASPVICIVPEESIQSPKSHKKKHKHKHKKQKKHEEDVEEEDNLEPIIKKKKLSVETDSVEPVTPTQSSKETQSDKGTPDAKSKNKTKETEKGPSDSGSESSAGEGTGEAKTKRRKRRRRKRKTSTKTAIEVSKLCMTPVVNNPKPVSVFRHGSVFPNRPTPVRGPMNAHSDGKHVHFDSDSEPPAGMAQQNTNLETVPNQNISNGERPSSFAITETVVETAEPRFTTPVSPENVSNHTTTPEIQHHRKVNSNTITDSSETHPMDTSEANGNNQVDEETDKQLLHSMTSMAGYQVVPPPSDYKPQNQQRGGRRNRPNKGPAGLLQGAQVFSRRRLNAHNPLLKEQEDNRRRGKKNAYHPLSKEEQLNTVATNRSTIYENPHLDTETDSWNGAATMIVQEPPKDYSSMEQLHGLPREKEKIAFKILEISEDCTPQMSDFQEATVLRYDPQTKCVDLEMLNSEQRQPRRFDLVVEDDEEILTNVSTDLKKTVSWSSLVDVRLIPST